ncbi:LysR family transcriptional regulator [Oxalobacteraceae bacterium A2-2]
MNHTEPDWGLYRTFLAVMAEGSLSGAARALGLTQPTVGRHIDALEQGLSLSLFTRSQNGFSPTEAAFALQSYAQTLASTSAALLRAASSIGRGEGQEIQGRVRITAAEVVGVEVLPPILARLHEQHPGIVVELGISNRIENLIRRDADIAIRMQRPEQDVLIARRVGVIELGLHAHRDYLKRRGKPRSWDDLAGHSLIGVERENAFTRSISARLAGVARAHIALRSDNDLLHLGAIRAGLGLGICQVGAARRYPGVERVLPGLLSIELETWIAMHENLRSNPACSATFTTLAEGLEDYIRGAAAPEEPRKKA